MNVLAILALCIVYVIHEQERYKKLINRISTRYLSQAVQLHIIDLMSFINKNKLLFYWKTASKNNFFKYGAPFFILVLGGSVYLKQFTSLRYQFSKTVKNLRPEEIEGLVELKAPGEVTLESEYEKIKEADIENWSNKRGPRPWEEGQES